MSGHIGTLANLLPALPTREGPVSSSDRFAIQDASRKRWAFAKSNGPRLRTWQVETPALTSEQAGALTELAEGAWGNGPFVFIPCSAHASNVLTPAQSLLEGVANSGPVILPGGDRAPRSLVGGGIVTLADKVPVIPGRPATFSIYMAGGSATVSFKTVSGSTVGSRTLAPTGDLMLRASATALSVPVTARYATITAAGYTALARPQLSWTAEPVAWAAGGGAAQVVIQNSSLTHLRGGWANASVQIVEVG